MNEYGKYAPSVELHIGFLLDGIGFYNDFIEFPIVNLINVFFLSTSSGVDWTLIGLGHLYIPCALGQHLSLLRKFDLSKNYSS